ncbi:MAG: hypothetical protein DSY80_02790 [Desulfocapsa sp.]|nr:MAG: hypothetical protein DSY80_02790 [Desulfocapsa sp.]
MTIKVLIVDDEPINVKLIEEILQYEEGFQYRSAVDGESALALLDEYNPDIIILDIMMPGMNGYDVCREIKKRGRHKFSKILMVSGKSLVEERLEGYSAGADDYITKPFVDDELLAKLKVFSDLKKTEEIDELKTGILQLFSHETKTPLNGILLGSQLILDTPSLPDKVIEYAKLIKISGERIHDLVRKILLLSSLKNRRSLNYGVQAIRQYLEGIISKNSLPFEDECSFTIDCPENFSLEVDWKLFHEAFYAAIQNAIKFSPKGGLISISAKCDEEHACLKIHDDGPGIEPALIERIFDEFYSQNIENHSKGTALSLAIGQKIMNLHDGNLYAESTKGEGATFVFTFPLSAVIL